MKTKTSTKRFDSKYYTSRRSHNHTEELLDKTLSELKLMDGKVQVFLETETEKQKDAHIEVLSTSDAFLTLETVQEKGSYYSHPTTVLLVRTIVYKESVKETKE